MSFFPTFTEAKNSCDVTHYNIGFILSVGAAKVNKVKIFSRPCYMIKRVLTFVSDVQESVLVDFISQNFA